MGFATVAPKIAFAALSADWYEGREQLAIAQFHRNFRLVDRRCFGGVDFCALGAVKISVA
jgi:hypothetical protein